MENKTLNDLIKFLRDKRIDEISIDVRKTPNGDETEWVWSKPKGLTFGDIEDFDIYSVVNDLYSYKRGGEYRIELKIDAIHAELDYYIEVQVTDWAECDDGTINLTSP